MKYQKQNSKEKKKNLRNEDLKLLIFFRVLLFVRDYVSFLCKLYWDLISLRLRLNCKFNVNENLQLRLL